MPIRCGQKDSSFLSSSNTGGDADVNRLTSNVTSLQPLFVGRSAYTCLSRQVMGTTSGCTRGEHTFSAYIPNLDYTPPFENESLVSITRLPVQSPKTGHLPESAVSRSNRPRPIKFGCSIGIRSSVLFESHRFYT